MPISLKLGELLNAKPVLEKLIKLKFSFKTNYRLARRLRVINQELITYDETITKLIREIGTPIPDGSGRVQIAQVTPSQIQKTGAEVNRLEEEMARARADITGVRAESDPASILAELTIKHINAVAEHSALVKNLETWRVYEGKIAELRGVEITLDVEPIRLSELQNSSGEEVINDSISVEDTMLLFPLLEEEDEDE